MMPVLGAAMAAAVGVAVGRGVGVTGIGVGVGVGVGTGVGVAVGAGVGVGVGVGVGDGVGVGLRNGVGVGPPHRAGRKRAELPTCGHERTDFVLVVVATATGADFFIASGSRGAFFGSGISRNIAGARPGAPYRCSA